MALQASLEEETRRAHASASANVGIVAAALERDARCSRSRLQALETMQRLQAAGVKLVWRSNGWWGGDGGANGLTCTSADEERARRIVGDIGARAPRDGFGDALQSEREAAAEPQLASH